MAKAGAGIFPFRLSVDSLFSQGFASYLTLLFHVPNKLQKWLLLSCLEIRKGHLYSNNKILAIFKSLELREFGFWSLGSYPCIHNHSLLL